MRETILQTLKEIEAKKNIKILYAVESGSRAWGFASEDSDYDVRFIYIRPLRDYLEIFPRRDVIEWEINDVWDINGWDLKKMLQLLSRTNPTIFEWAKSPIVYYTTPEWQEILPVIHAWFEPKPCLFHYLSMAKKNYKTSIKGDTIKYKRYFYVFRTLLACRWILERNEPAPMEFSELMKQELPDEVRSEIERLLVMKTTLGEAAVGAPIVLLNEYIERSIAELEGKVRCAPDPTKRANITELEDCFRRCLGVDE
jgi:predicted nucleotidyltransferase